MSGLPQVKCPTCRKTGDWFAEKYGPFCSHRCKLVDLGKWFAEEHNVSSPLRSEHLESMRNFRRANILIAPSKNSPPASRARFPSAQKQRRQSSELFPGK